MEVPKVLRGQLRHYEAHGFTVVSVEPRAGSHFRVVFAEFSEPQFLTKNGSDPRAWKNNVARFKRLAAQAVTA